MRQPPRAEVSEVVAAELAFARAAQEDGQWTAFADYAAPEGVMFVPEAVIARDWLKGRANPPQAVRWQPHAVFSSCDGSLAVTRGAWQRPDGAGGYFTTAWARQRNGEYRWVLDQGDTLAAPLPAPEMIASQVADCRGRPEPGSDRARVRSAVCDASGCRGGGESGDATLRYDYVVRPGGARSFQVALWHDGAYANVVQSEVAAE